jgi:hypothetical protein
MSYTRLLYLVVQSSVKSIFNSFGCKIIRLPTGTDLGKVLRIQRRRLLLSGVFDERLHASAYIHQGFLCQILRMGLVDYFLQVDLR